MTKREFVDSEVQRFDEGCRFPFRVAVGGADGEQYPYGSHTERREYADHTVGYTYSFDEAVALLGEAFDHAAECRKWSEDAA